MNIMALISALPGATAQGLIWGIMAIGVYITFRTLDIADLTVDGTMCTGGAVCIMMMMNVLKRKVILILFLNILNILFLKLRHTTGY